LSKGKQNRSKPHCKEATAEREREKGRRKRGEGKSKERSSRKFETTGNFKSGNRRGRSLLRRCPRKWRLVVQNQELRGGRKGPLYFGKKIIFSVRNASTKNAPEKKFLSKEFSSSKKKWKRCRTKGRSNTDRDSVCARKEKRESIRVLIALEKAGSTCLSCKQDPCTKK